MTLPQLARTLGFAGLIPFGVFSVATWLTPPPVDNAHFVLSAYAAVILSFMGAIHWGVAMSADDAIARAELGLSVVPALLGWLALLIPALPGYVLLIVCFVALYLADRLAHAKGRLPDWYMPMRAVLTAIVVLCLAVAALAPGAPWSAV